MISLSENAINQRAPYKVEQTGDTSFMFFTTFAPSKVKRDIP